MITQQELSAPGHAGGVSVVTDRLIELAVRYDEAMKRGITRYEVVFIDEVDTVEARGPGVHSSAVSLQNYLLASIVSDNANVFISCGRSRVTRRKHGPIPIFWILATNMIDMLDPALIRPGRCPPMLVDNPSTDEKMKYVEKILNTMNASSLIDIDSSVTAQFIIDRIGGKYSLSCMNSILSKLFDGASKITCRSIVSNIKTLKRTTLKEQLAERFPLPPGHMTYFEKGLELLKFSKVDGDIAALETKSRMGERHKLYLSIHKLATSTECTYVFRMSSIPSTLSELQICSAKDRVLIVRMGVEGSRMDLMNDIKNLTTGGYNCSIILLAVTEELPVIVL